MRRILKIVYVNQFSDYSVVPKLKVAALRRLGHEVLEFDDNAVRLPVIRQLPPRLARWIKRKHYFLSMQDRSRMNRALLAAVNDFKPDLVVVDKGIGVQYSTVQQIRSTGAITANWFPDDLQSLNWVLANALAYDYFFHFDSFSVSQLRAQGHPNAYLLPLGCAPDLHRTIRVSERERAQYDCDICFVGSCHSRREEVLSCLTDYKLKIWGYKDWECSPLSRFYMGKITNGVEMVKLHNIAGICLNIHYKSEAHGANMRTFEIAGCGGFQVVDYRQDMEDCFEDGKEIIIFKETDDLRRKIDYYLRHEAERATIAKAGQVRAYRDHTLLHRAERLVRIVMGQDRQQEPSLQN